MQFKELRINIFILLTLFVVACGNTPTPETVIVKETVIVTSIPKPITPTPEPRVIFQDDFEDEDSGWSIVDRELYNAYYQDGEYHIFVKKSFSQIRPLNRELQSLDDFILDIDITLVSFEGNRGIAGVVFRYVDADNFYGLFFDNDGFLSIIQMLDEEISHFIEGTKIDALNTGNSTNHIRLELVESQITAYVNDELVAVIPDRTFRRGDIRPYVITLDEGNTEISIDNFKVTEIE